MAVLLKAVIWRMRFGVSVLTLVAFLATALAAEDLSEIRARAESGDAAAQFELGRHYETRSTNASDQRRALDWYARAAGEGSAKAQFTLGKMYVLGNGVERDEAKGVDWQKKAAGQGLAEAQYAIGKRYLFGVVLDQDFEQALDLITAAANQGLVDAQNQLGSMYFQGEGVTKDVVQAHMWFSIAAQADNQSAKRYLPILESVMDDAQIENAVALATKWQAEHTFD